MPQQTVAQQCEVQAPSVIRVDTKDAVGVVSKETYVSAALTIEAGDGQAAVTLKTKIKGRGNTTWSQEKKPYRLKLDAAAALLGMNPNKNWALLANHLDRSMLRNALGLCLAKVLKMPWSSDYRFVELHLDGGYLGLYQLAEHVEVADRKVELGAPTSTPETDLGFLVELDSRAAGDDYYFYANNGQSFSVKSDTNWTEVSYIKSFIDKLGVALTDPAQVAMTQWRALVDADSVSSAYVVYEFLKNNDAFYTSTYMHRPWGAKLVFAPVWDFDMASGNTFYNGNEHPEGWWLKDKPYIGAMLATDDELNTDVDRKMRSMTTRLPEILRWMDITAMTLDAAQRRNFERWPVLNTPFWEGQATPGTYQGEVDQLKTWTTDRVAWINGNSTLRR